nr:MULTISPECIES: hypothetical protein [unclassified Anabaena]
MKSAERRHDPKTVVVVAIVTQIPIAIRRPTIPSVVVPRTAAQESESPTPR